MLVLFLYSSPLFCCVASSHSLLSAQFHSYAYLLLYCALFFTSPLQHGLDRPAAARAEADVLRGKHVELVDRRQEDDEVGCMVIVRWVGERWIYGITPKPSDPCMHKYAPEEERPWTMAKRLLRAMSSGLRSFPATLALGAT